MAGTPYGIADAERDLRASLGRAPAGAVAGAWSATTLQAGHAEISGGYTDAGGRHLDPEPRHAFDAVGAVVERLAAAGGAAFNRVEIRWTRAPFPLSLLGQPGRIRVETAFDPAIVPRGPEDPAYEAAAAARRRFWDGRGRLLSGFAAQDPVANIHGQTKWFGPHRRVLLLHPAGGSAGGVVLATDGLSTPWAGIPDPENGVACEIALRLPEGEGEETERVGRWTNILMSLGDRVADGYRVARDVEKHGAILFSRLPAACAPFEFVILAAAADDAVIRDLPFGSVPLLEAVPVTAAEVARGDPDEAWEASTARAALARRDRSAPL
ncbi:hypothetical protein C0214_05565 [Methylobacterium sp. DM1]|nr:hypothetical protein C0214_05565 [Methylobacterium sp. DM1]